MIDLTEAIASLTRCRHCKRKMVFNFSVNRWFCYSCLSRQVLPAQSDGWVAAGIVSTWIKHYEDLNGRTEASTESEPPGAREADAVDLFTEAREKLKAKAEANLTKVTAGRKLLGNG